MVALFRALKACDGSPAALPIVRNVITVRVTPSGDGADVLWIAEPELKAHGYLVYPVLKAGLRAEFSRVLAQLKEHAEARRAA